MTNTVWDKQDAPKPKVLVACPTYAGCAYSLAQWADAYHAFTYENKGALQVDNSDENLHYTHLIRAQGITALYEPHRFNFLWDTLELSWRRIVEYAHDNGYDLIASIEADVICPPETLDVMVSEWQKAGHKSIVAHRYHPRGTPPEGDYWFDTLGCVLFPTELLYDSRDNWMAIVEVELYLQAQDNGYERVRLKDILDIQHLDDPDRGKVTAYPQPANNRLHPGVPTVKRPIPRGEEASAKRSIFSIPHGMGIDDPAQEARDALKMDCLERGKWEAESFDGEPLGNFETPEEAQGAIREASYSKLYGGKSLEEQNRSLRLLCNQLFAEVDRLKGGECSCA